MFYKHVNTVYDKKIYLKKSESLKKNTHIFLQMDLLYTVTTNYSSLIKRMKMWPKFLIIKNSIKYFFSKKKERKEMSYAGLL